MSKYINVDEIDYKVICYPHLDLYTRTVSTEELDGVYALKTDIDAMPPADVEEVRHGKWIYEGYYDVRGTHSNVLSAEGGCLQIFQNTFLKRSLIATVARRLKEWKDWRMIK